MTTQNVKKKVRRNIQRTHCIKTGNAVALLNAVVLLVPLPMINVSILSKYPLKRGSGCSTDTQIE